MQSVKQGRFISFEGGEGTGKSTQILKLADWLRQYEIEVTVTREPGGTDLGESIRGLLLDVSLPAMHQDTELLLMFAARAEHVQRVIKPALERGEWVLSDRFADASFVYQGAGRGIPQERLDSLADWTLQGFVPDRTLLLDMTVSGGMERVRQRGGSDRFEQENTDFFERIRQAYLQRAQAYPERFSVQDASQSIDEVHKNICSAVEAWISS